MDSNDKDQVFRTGLFVGDPGPGTGPRQPGKKPVVHRDAKGKVVKPRGGAKTGGGGSIDTPVIGAAAVALGLGGVCAGLLVARRRHNGAR